MSTARSKFATIVEFAQRRIRSGNWMPGDRAPSEHELCERFGVSRMTARKAMDRLVLTGHIVRRRGSGSYIADDSVRSSFLVVRSIADEVQHSGRRYSARVLRQCVVRCDAECAAELALERGARVFHSLVVHMADDQPVQLEYRYVRPDAAPDYLAVDLSAETPNHYLQRICPLVEARQEVTATLPKARQSELLGVSREEPCLLITRVTSAQSGLVSYARILAPANRYRLSGRLHFTSQLTQ